MNPMHTPEAGRPLPTDAEFRVLDVLWAGGPMSVRGVHDQIRRDSDVTYTTVLKILQNLLGKGLVHRDDSARSHVYEAAVERDWATRGFVADLADRVFDGSAAKLVMRALSDQTPSREELDEVRALLDRLEAEGG